MIDTGLKDKVILITGINNPHGIGAAMAAAFAQQGAAVFGTYLRLPAEPGRADQPGEAFLRAQNAKDAVEIVETISRGGGRIETREADLADPAVLPRLFDWAEAAFGPVDVLVDNAAHCEQDTFLPGSEVGQHGLAVDGFPMSTLTAELHDRHFAVNSRAVALLMAEFARRSIARAAGWGRIINISTDGASGFATEVSYGASKHAMESYSRAAAQELGRYGITVNVLSLGPTQTGWITPEMEAGISVQIKMKEMKWQKPAVPVQ